MYLFRIKEKKPRWEPLTCHIQDILSNNVIIIVLEEKYVSDPRNYRRLANSEIGKT